MDAPLKPRGSLHVLTPDQLSQQEERLRWYQGPDEVVLSAALALELQMTPEKVWGCVTKFPSLDTHMGGCQAGDLVVVSGFTKHGKTLLLQSITRNLARMGVMAVWFSYELPYRQFLAIFPKMPLFCLSRQLKDRTLDWIFERMWEAKIKYGARVVMIDHLHFLFSLTKSINNTSLEIGDLVRQIKAMAMELEMVIFLVCHTTKMASDRRATAADLRDSGLIACEADTVLMVTRMQDADQTRLKGRPVFTAQTEVEVALCRRTGAMGEAVSFQKINGWLEEVTDVPF